MTILTAWLQDDAHSAASDRHYLDSIAGGVARVLWGLQVSAGPGAMQVTVAPGQGFARDFTGVEAQSVLVTNDAPLVWTIPAPGLAGDRAVGFRFVRVTESVMAGDLGPFDPVSDVDDLVLASIALTPSTTSITAGMITDVRKVAPIARIMSGPSLPPAESVPLGTVFVVTEPT